MENLRVTYTIFNSPEEFGFRSGNEVTPPIHRVVVQDSQGNIYSQALDKLPMTQPPVYHIHKKYGFSWIQKVFKKWFWKKEEDWPFTQYPIIYRKTYKLTGTVSFKLVEGRGVLYEITIWQI